MAYVEQERVEFRTSVPGQYTFRIKSFSALMEILKYDGAESYESPEFESGGHKWKLSLCPNGNTGLGGAAHVSLYLAIADSHLYESEICVVCKMLAWDQIRDEFLAVQDCKVRKFDSTKRQWGFARLMRLDTFEDPFNGYLVDDCCAFGVEVRVVSPAGRVDSLSIIKQPANRTFKWTLDKFSTLTAECYNSSPFTVEDQQWNLSVYPNGDSTRKGSCLSLFLVAYDVKCHGGSEVYVDATLRIRDRLQSKHHEFSIHNWFDGSSCWGYPAFLPLTDLKDEAKGFLIDDSLDLEATINAVSKITDIKAEAE